ncbi:MAG: 3-demethylubiquinone-9 3-O-methyltransferase [Solirubrobacterales bacterium]|nr:3-demethylubiquinone-9 3-O-methyltransferase [Solirubrobacterales bacterium]
MPVDNELYDRLSHTWWDDAGFLNILQSALNPARVAFLERALRSHFGELGGLRVLDVGCGGGLLAEALAGCGCSVTGIDPSRGSLAVAREHAARGGWQIDYHPGVAESLPLPDGAVDAVVCCDVLEHVRRPRQAVAEAARVLRPGGLYLYDTINRTRRSKLLFIKLFQEWKPTAFMEPNLHDHAMFIRPQEMEAHLRAAGLKPSPIVGLAPSIPLPRAIALLRARARGQITYGDLGRGLHIAQSRDTSGLFAGTAAKSPAPAPSTRLSARSSRLDPAQTAGDDTPVSGPVRAADAFEPGLSERTHVTASEQTGSPTPS